MEIVIVGSGGREYSIGLALQSECRVDGIYFYPGNGATSKLGKNIDALDEDIEELEDSGLNRTVETLCKARNSLNLERLDLEIHICKLRLWLAEFERARQMTR